MGMSLSADVFWGFDLGSDDELDEDTMPQWWRDDQEWEEVLAQRLGWTEVPFPKALAPAGMDDYRTDRAERDRLYKQFCATPEYQKWSTNRDQLHELVKGIGVEVDGYGYECGASAVRIKASVQNCDYGAARLTALEAGADWLDQVSRFCELLEIPIPEAGPGWHVCATWA